MMVSLGDLQLRARRNHTQPERIADRLRLDGRVEWLVTGPSAQLDEIEVALPGIAEALGSVLLLRFDNTVGRFAVPHLGEVEVHSSKWDRRDFDAMLADLTRVAAQLPFQASGGGALPYERTLSVSQPVLYQLFAYLRWVLSDECTTDEALLPALQAVMHEPHRRLEKESHRVPFALARDVAPAELAAIVSGVRPMVRAAGAAVGWNVARRLGGQLPEVVDEVRSRWDVDTAENRFVKFFLMQVDGVIDRVHAAFPEHRTSSLHASIQADCGDMRRRLEVVRRAGLWCDVGEMRHFPASSTVLQERRGYKTIYRCFVRMLLGSRLPLDEEQARRLLEIRDIADLYELWCYFRLVELAQDVLGPPLSAERFDATDLSVKVPWNYRVSWPGGESLYYNLSFGAGCRTPAGRRSYSVQLRPDVVLELLRGPSAGLHLFDAKFKLTQPGRRSALGNGVLEEAEDLDHDPELATGRERGSFVKADLYKMHTYRDAIENARSVWVMYPGSKSRWFPTYEGQYDGVGVMPLVPGEEGGGVFGDLLRNGQLAG